MAQVRARLLIVIGLLSVLAGAALAYAARGTGLVEYRFDVLAHVDPKSSAYHGDVYGFAGHAYLSSHKGRHNCPAEGVRVYDLADVRAPVLASRFADAGSEPALAGTWTEKTIVKRVETASFRGDIAVTSVQSCTSRAFRGFALHDVTNPRRPKKLALVRTEPRGSHELWLQASRKRAWVYTAIIASELRSSPDGRRPGQADFRIFDISNPRAPRRIGEWGAWRALKLHPQPEPGPSLDANFVHSVITNAAATRAYLSYWKLGTVVLDISRPSKPKYLGRTSTVSATTANSHSAALGRNGLLVETHERTGGKVTLFAVSKTGVPRKLSEFGLTNEILAGRGGLLQDVTGISLTDSVHDPKVVGDLAYFSWYGQGVVLVDVSNPREPRFLTRFLPTPATDAEELLCPSRRCTAVWGVFATRDYVLVSDMNSGLWVLRVNRQG